jgi:hypothetical protein
LDGTFSGLPQRPKDGVGGDAEQEVPLVGETDERLGGGTIDADGLLAPDMLAGFEGGGGDLDMGRRDGEVDDDLHIVMSQD